MFLYSLSFIVLILNYSLPQRWPMFVRVATCLPLASILPPLPPSPPLPPPPPLPPLPLLPQTPTLTLLGSASILNQISRSLVSTQRPLPKEICQKLKPKGNIFLPGAQWTRSAEGWKKNGFGSVWHVIFSALQSSSSPLPSSASPTKVSKSWHLFDEVSSLFFEDFSKKLILLF